MEGRGRDAGMERKRRKRQDGRTEAVEYNMAGLGRMQLRKWEKKERGEEWRRCAKNRILGKRNRKDKNEIRAEPKGEKMTMHARLRRINMTA